MNQCKNCKYFKRYTGEYGNKNYGRCQSNKILYAETNEDGVDYWNNTKEERHTLKDTDLLLYMDSDAYYAKIEVGQDFGCIHYQKETENDKKEIQKNTNGQI